MGFYIRKSVSVGPLRFNLSHSGIGVSVGIPGFRIGSGPRGTYVHMGSGGLYYRQTLASPGQQQQSHHLDRTSDYASPERLQTHGPMVAIGSGCVTEMIDSSSAALLEEINRKRRRIILWPCVLVVTLFLAAALLFLQVTYWLALPCILLLFLATALMHQYDRLEKCVVLMYELDGGCLDAYQSLFAASSKMAQCGAVWHITARGKVYDPKYHAGAGQLVNRRRIAISQRNPPYVKTNVPIPCLPLRQHSLYFLPDRILVYAPNGVGAVAYDQLRLSAYPTRFIETGFLPRDASVVDYTWRFVNKNGGPDRRFNNNHQVPICQYEELQLSSANGISEIFQLSRLGVSAHLKFSIAAMADAICQAEVAEQKRRRHVDDLRETARLAEAARQVSQKQDTLRPTRESLHSTLLEILCCVMVADGRASAREKSAIRGVMSKVNADLTDSQLDQRIRAFLDEVRSRGYSAVLGRVMVKLQLDLPRKS